MTTPRAIVADLAIRPPAQERSRAAWGRVLDAGVALLEGEGYEAFTIAAVCERADVAPSAIYARASNKDALYLAVYEHGMTRIHNDQALLTNSTQWSEVSDQELVKGIVTEVARLFFAHARLLRSVVRTSGIHPEVLRRGEEYSRQLGALFVARVLERRGALVASDPEAHAWHCFNVIFATSAMRISNGPKFAARTIDDGRFTEQLVELASSYLLRGTSNTD